MAAPLPPDRLPCPWQDERQAAARLRQELSGRLNWSAVRQQCEPWIRAVRQAPGPSWALESLLQRFPLSSREGLAMMRLAEALLRVTDDDTALALAADQLKGHDDVAARHGDWLTSWVQRGLRLSRQLLPEADAPPADWLQQLGGPPLVAAMARALGLLGRQFVLGQTTEEALKRAEQQRLRAEAQGQCLCFSIDMLGEGARTADDAARHLAAYRGALAQLSGGPARHGASLSIKLSALHPRLEPTKATCVVAELLPALTALVSDALTAGVAITIDAEESWRLELQLQLLDRLLGALDASPAPGSEATLLGVAVQAYQHRAGAVIDELARLAQHHGRRLAVRLVKGAYWDSEIKRSQELGLPGYAVFTHKAHTDLNYLSCADQLLRHRAWLSPQFATHNAATVAAVMQLAQRRGVPLAELEWQRLHGMGEATWREILSDPAMHTDGPPRLRIYAPVGTHRDLLAYLVRRLLENGANGSFVHQLLDATTPLDRLLRSPLTEEPSSLATQAIPLPALLFGPERSNAEGRDLHHAAHRERLDSALTAARLRHPVTDTVAPTTAVASCMAALQQGAAAWADRSLPARCQILDDAAHRIEQSLDSWAADLVLEAHKTWPDAVAEVREVIDYARYYAQQARDGLPARNLPGPTGELNEWRLRPRGVWVCIAPWNFPLAIFGGQVMAALVTGNTVAAKPAAQTPEIAIRFTALLHESGVPADALVCVPGAADAGQALIADPHCAGVAFTGSMATARRIQQQLALRADGLIVPLIAETGGVNVLIADPTALTEQLVDSVMASAFGSAGQRCSALRLLCVHTALAKDVEIMLAGALGHLTVGTPQEWATDVGPVIDTAAQHRLLAHIAALDASSQDPANGVRLLARAPDPQGKLQGQGAFVTPCAYALSRVADLEQEHFGPVLHVVRWGPGTPAPTLNELIDQINATGYGLTLGIHTRIDSRARHIAWRAKVGNVYVNRGMTGAVVGSQPFGGQGLSGTGPKAGGPLYLPRFCTEQVVCTNTAAAGGDTDLMAGT